MTTGAQLAWGEDGAAGVESVDDLDRHLDDLTERAREKPFLAELALANGDSLAIGLGRDESILSWIQGSHDPPYYVSQGDPEAEGVVVFNYGGQWSEFPKWSLVPIAEAREAMRHFVRTGHRPTNVAWVEG